MTVTFDSPIDCRLQVKILYVRNLMLGTTEETIGKVFNEASGADGAVERVKKIRDYAFVHFKEREDAISAMKFLNGKYQSLNWMDADDWMWLSDLWY